MPLMARTESFPCGGQPWLAARRDATPVIRLSCQPEARDVVADRKRPYKMAGLLRKSPTKRHPQASSAFHHFLAGNRHQATVATGPRVKLTNGRAHSYNVRTCRP